MFDENSPSAVSEQLASGQYESSKDDMLKGFAVFQKKFAGRNVIIQMILVFIAIMINVVNIITANDGDYGGSILIILLCVFIGANILTAPKRTYKKLSRALENLEGVIYGCDIFTDKIIISTLHDPLVEKGGEDRSDTGSAEDSGDAPEETEDSTAADNDADTSDAPEETDENDGLPPATLIHIDNGGVEMMECNDMYVIYIRKQNVFVIPFKAFSDEENEEVRKRLPLIMGTRYHKINA